MIDLAAMRRAAGLTQTQLAANLGVGQAQISKVERQDDMLITTLASYLTALGVDASLVVEVGEQTLTYDLTAGRGDESISCRPAVICQGWALCLCSKCNGGGNDSRSTRQSDQCVHRGIRRTGR